MVSTAISVPVTRIVLFECDCTNQLDDETISALQLVEMVTSNAKTDKKIVRHLHGGNYIVEHNVENIARSSAMFIIATYMHLCTIPGKRCFIKM